ncbi:MAG: hypothetical protein EOP48_20225 [Sphingobacteriales bacterium]|nr:MAG: hypothetical protein EOP48_20225 [Sphingobacteriales bacterium]
MNVVEQFVEAPTHLILKEENLLKTQDTNLPSKRRLKKKKDLLITWLKISVIRLKNSSNLKDIPNNLLKDFNLIKAKTLIISKLPKKKSRLCPESWKEASQFNMNLKMLSTH